MCSKKRLYCVHTSSRVLRCGWHSTAALVFFRSTARKELEAIEAARQRVGAVVLGSDQARCTCISDHTPGRKKSVASEWWTMRVETSERKKRWLIQGGRITIKSGEKRWMWVAGEVD